MEWFNLEAFVDDNSLSSFSANLLSFNFLSRAWYTLSSLERWWWSSLSMLVNLLHFSSKHLFFSSRALFYTWGSSCICCSGACILSLDTTRLLCLECSGNKISYNPSNLLKYFAIIGGRTLLFQFKWSSIILNQNSS